MLADALLLRFGVIAMPQLSLLAEAKRARLAGHRPQFFALASRRILRSFPLLAAAARAREVSR